MLISMDYVNKTRGYKIGEDEPFEPFTDDIKRLFQHLQREYGKCVSKVYVDSPDNKPRAIGWIFEKLQKYDDCKDKFLCETWVTLHDEKPTRKVEYHYHNL